MIANVGPASYNHSETLGTLRFAARARSIKNKPKVNQDPKDAMLNEMIDQIKKYKDELRRITEANGGIMPQGAPPGGLTPLGQQATVEGM